MARKPSLSPEQQALFKAPAPETNYCAVCHRMANYALNKDGHRTWYCGIHVPEGFCPPSLMKLVETEIIKQEIFKNTSTGSDGVAPVD